MVQENLRQDLRNNLSTFLSTLGIELKSGPCFSTFHII